MMGALSPKVPPHLRRFVVAQDYTQYNAVDQAVWRFVLLQLHAKLAGTGSRGRAHASYRDGLAAAGISVDRIPDIAEMNEKLSRFGWCAVCVDGFIPPRAFQDFQAHGILPIAAAIRTREHLVYTPAPDIIHEAAGHAPILPDPTFAAYVRRFGELARKAFTLPEEDRVHRAIHALSEVKEDASADGDAVNGAEAELAAALAAVRETSEVTRLSRLYWWTAEYGLVGRTDDYELYGAGLLSSLGESHTCLAPEVRKIPLDERCMDVPYDITQPQPQLFVVPSFEALHGILDRVGRELAVEVGGAVALERAVRSHEVATVHFSSGAQVIGVLDEVGPTPKEPAWLWFKDATAFAEDGVIGAGDDARQPFGCIVLTGNPAFGESVQELGQRAELAGRASLRFASGAAVEGLVERLTPGPSGRWTRMQVSDARLTLPGRPPITRERCVVLAAGHPLTAHAGSVDPAYYPETAFSSVRIPRARRYAPREQRLQSLYAQAERAHRRGAESVRAAFPHVFDVLVRKYPGEWLLRWNLLESLLKARESGPIVGAVRADLEALEVGYDHRQPIASGLAYLSRRAA